MYEYSNTHDQTEAFPEEMPTIPTSPTLSPGIDPELNLLNSPHTRSTTRRKYRDKEECPRLGACNWCLLYHFDSLSLVISTHTYTYANNKAAKQPPKD